MTLVGYRPAVLPALWPVHVQEATCLHMAGVHAVRCLQCRLGGANTGVEEDVGPGDVMVIPAGVAHERYAAPFSATLYNRHKVTGKMSCCCCHGCWQATSLVFSNLCPMYIVATVGVCSKFALRVMLIKHKSHIFAESDALRHLPMELLMTNIYLYDCPMQCAVQRWL